jgi:hypothetical protein
MAADPLSFPPQRSARSRRIKKLTNVVSTKVSSEDYLLLQQLTEGAYQAHAIEEPSKSEFLRLIISLVFGELRNKPEILPHLLNNRSR